MSQNIFSRMGKIFRKQKVFAEFKWNLVGISGKIFLDFLFFTTKIEQIMSEDVKKVLASRRYIGAFWHSRILLVCYLYQHQNGAILVSRSEDGEIIARIVRKQGNEAIRGSTTHGGLRALAKLIKCLKEKDRPSAIIPDGPQGPRFKVQPGIIMLAKKTGYPIVPMTYNAKKKKVFASWDRFILPYPFTRCRMIYGNPMSVPEDADADIQEACRTQLETELCKITREVDDWSRGLVE